MIIAVWLACFRFTRSREGTSWTRFGAALPLAAATFAAAAAAAR